MQTSTGIGSKLDEFRNHLTRATHGVFEQPVSGRLTTEGLEMESKQAEVAQTTGLTKEDRVWIIDKTFVTLETSFSVNVARLLLSIDTKLDD